MSNAKADAFYRILIQRGMRLETAEAICNWYVRQDAARAALNENAEVCPGCDGSGRRWIIFRCRICCGFGLVSPGTAAEARVDLEEWALPATAKRQREAAVARLKRR